ncbi:DUF3800 domain-containing protein [Rhizobium leguminosarum]|uniref:hypothetical protein n=1 Tax=Rhizobium leguminosarum TaxID=384 RepID=UPI001C93C737|nr:hypothetical protein [Rhizobium leguminosarum]MBY5762563.1 DUF3800 domain-containing protein [Rhizobium leguminosarum]
MHLLYCDETNLEKRSGEFLIYGGVFIDGARAKEFSLAVDALRTKHHVPREYRLKFNPGPQGFSQERFIALKQELIELAHEFDIGLIVYVILHDISVSPNLARRNGINTVCYHFDCVLHRLQSPGLVLIDRFNDEGNAVEAHLRDKFTVGLTGMPYGDGNKRLTNIVGFHYSAIGQSHFPSLVDVVLGSLRFAINAHTRNRSDYEETAVKLLTLISPLFVRLNGSESVSELGFLYSPKVIKVAKYRARYKALKLFLAAGGIDTTQEITDQRSY